MLRVGAWTRGFGGPAAHTGRRAHQRGNQPALRAGRDASKSFRRTEAPAPTEGHRGLMRLAWFWLLPAGPRIDVDVIDLEGRVHPDGRESELHVRLVAGLGQLTEHEHLHERRRPVTAGGGETDGLELDLAAIEEVAINRVHLEDGQPRARVPNHEPERGVGPVDAGGGARRRAVVCDRKRL